MAGIRCPQNFCWCYMLNTRDPRMAQKLHPKGVTSLSYGGHAVWVWEALAISFHLIYSMDFQQLLEPKWEGQGRRMPVFCLGLHTLQKVVGLTPLAFFWHQLGSEWVLCGFVSVCVSACVHAHEYAHTKTHAHIIMLPVNFGYREQHAGASSSWLGLGIRL